MSSFIHPVKAPITQPWGANPRFYARFGQRGHTGIDYGCPEGTPVHASADGTVAFAGHGADHGGFLSVAGNAILLSHGSVLTGYAHLSRISVSHGQQVKQGQVIGFSGSTGVVTGPHLHFEFWGVPTDWKNGWSGRVNPGNYMKEVVMDKISKEQENVLALLATGSYPGRNYNYRFTGKDATTGNISDMVNFWLAESKKSGGLTARAAELDRSVAQLRSRVRVLETQPGGEYQLLDTPVYIKKK